MLSFELKVKLKRFFSIFAVATGKSFRGKYLTESSVGQTVSMSVYCDGTLGLESGEMKHDMMVNPTSGSVVVDVT